jgi:hypothetical protein
MYPTPQQVVTPGITPPGRRRSPMLLTGVVLAVVGLIMCIGSVVLLVSSLIDTVKDVTNPRGDLAVEVVVPGTGQAELGRGRYELLALGQGLAVTVSGGIPTQGDQLGSTVQRAMFPDPSVTVTGPDGRALTTRSPSMQSIYDTPSTDAVSFAAFTVTDPGIHTIEVSGGGGAVRSVGIRDEATLRDTFLGVAIGFGIGTVGSTLLVLGIVLVIVAMVRRSRPAMP